MEMYENLRGKKKSKYEGETLKNNAYDVKQKYIFKKCQVENGGKK